MSVNWHNATFKRVDSEEFSLFYIEAGHYRRSSSYTNTVFRSIYIRPFASCLFIQLYSEFIVAYCIVYMFWLPCGVKMMISYGRMYADGWACPQIVTGQGTSLMAYIIIMSAVHLQRIKWQLAVRWTGGGLGAQLSFLCQRNTACIRNNSLRRTGLHASTADKIARLCDMSPVGLTLPTAKYGLWRYMRPRAHAELLLEWNGTSGDTKLGYFSCVVGDFSSKEIRWQFWQPPNGLVGVARVAPARPRSRRIQPVTCSHFIAGLQCMRNEHLKFVNRLLTGRPKRFFKQTSRFYRGLYTN